MAFWKGIAGKARKIIAPYFGVSGKARRVVRAWIGVGGKARLFYIYLDDIDRIEVELYSWTLYTNTTSEGGTLVASGKSAVGSNGGALSISGREITMGISGRPANYVLYCNFRYWIVLKGGTKLALTYPVSDSKVASATITKGSFSHSGREYWYPTVHLFGNQHYDETSGTWTHEASDSYQGLFRLGVYTANQTVSCKLTFGSVTLNGSTYTPTINDNRPA